MPNSINRHRFSRFWPVWESRTTTADTTAAGVSDRCHGMVTPTRPSAMSLKGMPCKWVTQHHNREPVKQFITSHHITAAACVRNGGAGVVDAFA